MVGEPAAPEAGAATAGPPLAMASPAAAATATAAATTRIDMLVPPVARGTLRQTLSRPRAIVSIVSGKPGQQ